MVLSCLSWIIADKAIHTSLEFRRRFRINKELFMKIVVGVREYDEYFRCKKDRTTRFRRFTSVHKCTAALRCIAYGADYLRMA
jgi:uncharacterized short protein YbdD (DUF466 family)